MEQEMGSKINDLIKSSYLENSQAELKQSMVQSGIQHLGVVCSVCQMNPIMGYRYMCPICEGFNLC
jgi:hypothetical protein